MSRFTDVLLVSPLADGSTWVIMRDFGYDVGAEASGDHIDVAVGFQTDFATIPRPFWIILPKWGRYGNATVIHDWLYWRQARPRPQADAILLEASRARVFPRYARTSGAARRRTSAVRSACASSAATSTRNLSPLPSPCFTATGTPSRYSTRFVPTAGTSSPGVRMPTRFRGSAPLTATSSPAASSRRTARSDPTASGSAYCSPENPLTKRPPRISPP